MARPFDSDDFGNPTRKGGTAPRSIVPRSRFLELRSSCRPDRANAALPELRTQVETSLIAQSLRHNGGVCAVPARIASLVRPTTKHHIKKRNSKTNALTLRVTKNLLTSSATVTWNRFWMGPFLNPKSFRSAFRIAFLVFDIRPRWQGQ